MANETQMAGRGSFGAGVEGTEGSAATINLSTGSALPAMGVKTMQTSEMLEVEVMAPHRGGTMRVPGAQSAGCDFETLLYPIGISGSSSRSIDEPALRLVGFSAPTYDAGAPKTLTRTLLSTGHGSVTLERQTIDKSGGSNGIKETWAGCRANGRIYHGPHDPLRLAVTNCRATSYTRADTSSAPSVVLRDTEGDRRMPFVAHSAAVTELEDQSAAVYGGKLLGLDIDLGNEIVEDRAVGSSALPYQVTINAKAPSGTLQVQRVQQADYDFFSRWLGAKWFSAILTYTASAVGSSNTTDTRKLSFCFQVTSIEEVEIAGVKALTLGIALVWPDDTTAAGRTAASPITIVDTSTT